MTESNESLKSLVFRAATVAVLTYITRETVNATLKAAKPHVKEFLAKCRKQETEEVTTA